jgi:glycosyltransferase involved in cell wall biosynthesis
VFDSVQPYADPRNKIIYVYQPNQGECGAANRGILNSSGKYITFIDSDDEYKPNHLSNCIDQIQYADLICSTATIVGETEQDFYVLDRTDLTKLIHIDNTVLFGTLFGKREIFESIKFRTEYGADAVFFQQASKLYTTAKIDLRSYIYYRNIPNSLTNLMKDKHETV